MLTLSADGAYMVSFTGISLGGIMKADLVNPFVESVYELFQTMLSSKVARVGLAVSDGQKRPAEIMALIGFSGVIRGTVALSLPARTCRAMVERLLGTETETTEETISDTISEMVNIVAGSAKARLSLKVKQILDLSLPVVLTGQRYEVYSPSQAVWLEIPFASDLGDFVLRLTFQVEAA